MGLCCWHSALTDDTAAGADRSLSEEDEKLPDLHVNTPRAARFIALPSLLTERKASVV